MIFEILFFFFFCSDFVQQLFRVHYNVILKGIDVDGDAVDLPPSLASFGGNGGTIIDSGTTLAYLPENLYKAVLDKVPKLSLSLFVLSSLYNHKPDIGDFLYMYIDYC